VPHDLLPRVPFLASACFGAALIAFSQSTAFALSLLLLAPAGFGMMMMGISTNTLVQGSVDDAMRGRVMAYYVMSFIGMVPLSALGAGALSHQIGAPMTLALGGALTIVAAAVAYWRR
jgi:predicted MFS family arabinose efflux permease